MTHHPHRKFAAVNKIHMLVHCTVTDTNKQRKSPPPPTPNVHQAGRVALAALR